MSSDSENSIVVIEDIKPKRRSSIFRPDTEPSRFNDVTTTIFPPSYAQKLIDENIKWKSTYTEIRSELIELKRKANENNTPHSVQSNNIILFEAFLKKAEEFFCQINNTIELNENILKFKNLRREELEKQIDITSQMLLEKLIA